MIKRKNLTEIKIWKIIEKIGLQAQQHLCRYLRIRKKQGPGPCFLLGNHYSFHYSYSGIEILLLKCSSLSEILT